MCLIFVLIFYYVFHDSELHFGSILAPKIDVGRPQERKGRPSILNNTPRIFNGFGLGRCPGGAKIHIKTAPEHRCDCCLVPCFKNDRQMQPKGHQFGDKTASTNLVKKNNKF